MASKQCFAAILKHNCKNSKTNIVGCQCWPVYRGLLSLCCCVS